MDKKKQFYTIVVTENNDFKKVEQAILDCKIKDYEVRGENPENDYADYPHIQVYTDKDTFAKVRLILDLEKAYW